MNIRPSTKLKVVSVSKLKTMTCLRRYFWKYVCNLESKKLNSNFWYGGVLGAGFEALLLGKSDKQVRDAMKKEDKTRLKGKKISVPKGYTLEDVLEDMALQRRLIETIVFGAKDQPEVRKMKMSRSQIMFNVPLRSGLTFCGTEDGEGTYRGKPCMFENKTTTSASDTYVTSLTYGTQVNSYAWAQRRLRKSYPTMCVGCIFQKTKKIVKQGQTLDGFIDEIHTDIHGGQIQLKTKVKIVEPQPEKFYRWHKFHLGSQTVRETGEDIERQAEILKLLYEDCGDKLLNPMKWPKQESKCADYKGCEFIQLCMNPSRWQMYADKFFMQRQMLYEEEKEELE